MTSAAKIGLLMLVGLIVLAVFIIKIEDLSFGEEGERWSVEALFPSAAGVDRHAPVRIAGVRVGKVEEIRLEGSQALLVLSLESGVELRQGARAQVTNMGMLGNKYVEVFPGDPSAPLLPEGAVLSGGNPPSFDNIMTAANEIGADVKEVTEALRLSLGGEQGADKIGEIVDNLRELTASLKELVATNQSNVNQTTENFREFSQTLRDELPAIAEKMNLLADRLTVVVNENRDNMKGSLENIRDLSDKLRGSADNLNAITGKIARGEGSIGKLINDEETVDNLNTTLESIDSGVDTLKNSLGRIERFRLDMGIRGESLVDDSESRFAFGFDLWTTEKRFFRIEGVDLPYGRTKTSADTLTTQYPDGRTETQTSTLVRNEDKIGINAQIGYRLFPSTTIRAGLFESAGGFGVDHHLVLARRPLRLTLEAYDFNREEASDPHLRIEGRYFLNSNLFLLAGWDDPLFSDRASIVIGGGVVWTDEDVKYSLGLAGSAIQ